MSDIPEIISSANSSPDAASQITYDMYAAWATTELLHPDDLRHYRQKVMEESCELLAAETEVQIVEEAGDFLWTLATGRELTKNKLDLDSPEPEFVAASLESIAESRRESVAKLSDEALKNGIQNATSLYWRKMKLAAMWSDAASEETKRDYMANVIDGLLPLLVAATTEYVHRHTGRTISEVLLNNVAKLEERIATNGLDKATRTAAAE
jgi:phosphoribosyl-ATP pyrophosphohydrolase